MASVGCGGCASLRALTDGRCGEPSSAMSALRATHAIAQSAATAALRERCSHGRCGATGKPQVNYTLDTTLHTVHGTFVLKRGTIRVEADGKASGEIVADAATSGQRRGFGARQKDAQGCAGEREVHARLCFRPDRVDGKFPAGGAVSVQMHGVFALHGSEHEIDCAGERRNYRRSLAWDGNVQDSVCGVGAEESEQFYSEGRPSGGSGVGVGAGRFRPAHVTRGPNIATQDPALDKLEFILFLTTINLTD